MRNSARTRETRAKQRAKRNALSSSSISDAVLGKKVAAMFQSENDEAGAAQGMGLGGGRGRGAVGDERARCGGRQGRRRVEQRQRKGWARGAAIQRRLAPARRRDMRRMGKRAEGGARG